MSKDTSDNDQRAIPTGKLSQVEIHSQALEDVLLLHHLNPSVATVEMTENPSPNFMHTSLLGTNTQSVPRDPKRPVPKTPIQESGVNVMLSIFEVSKSIVPSRRLEHSAEKRDSLKNEDLNDYDLGASTETLEILEEPYLKRVPLPSVDIMSSFEQLATSHILAQSGSPINNETPSVIFTRRSLRPSIIVDNLPADDEDEDEDILMDAIDACNDTDNLQVQVLIQGRTRADSLPLGTRHSVSKVEIGQEFEVEDGSTERLVSVEFALQQADMEIDTDYGPTIQPKKSHPVLQFKVSQKEMEELRILRKRRFMTQERRRLEKEYNYESELQQKALETQSNNSLIETLRRSITERSLDHKQGCIIS